MPERIQLRRTKGWRMPENTIKCDRSTRWGNPYRVNALPDEECAALWGWYLDKDWGYIAPANAKQATERFRAHLEKCPEARDAIRRELAGKNLACWCRPGDPCHVDVLMEFANG